MRHDDRYSIASERCVHVMAQHGIEKNVKNWRSWKKTKQFGIDLIGIVQFQLFGFTSLQLFFVLKFLFDSKNIWQQLSVKVHAR